MRTQLADECHSQKRSRTELRSLLAARYKFEDATIAFDTDGLKAAEQADSTPVVATPSVTCRRRVARRLKRFWLWATSRMVI